MLLAFGIRPYLAIAGALAFGLSSYMIVGLGVGHNSRIGAIAFMPLVMAGVHLVFSNRKNFGFWCYNGRAGTTFSGESRANDLLPAVDIDCIWDHATHRFHQG
jgi:hypothetical protein